MRITDLLKKEGIMLGARADSKGAVIDQAVDLMESTGCLADKEAYKRCVLAREEQGTTGIGEGVAIPHGKTEAVLRAGLAAMVLPEGVDYDSLDGQPAKLIFLIAAPNTEDNVHLDVLSRLSTLLMDEELLKSLMNAETPEAFLHLIDGAETARFGGEKPAAAQKEQLEKGAQAPKSASKGESGRSDQSYRILAVTACPTGIAHTYMAAEGLENAAKKLGVSIKVETDGSGGTKNRLTGEEIAAADCIIVAADKNVEMARFDGRPVIQTKVSDGINKADQLLEDALSGKAPIYHRSERDLAAPENTLEKQGVGRTIYKHLMNGVSHMLPFVIGGGILIAIAFLLDDFNMNPANFGMNTPVAAFFKAVGGAAFGLMMPILAGYIAMSIGDRPALAPGIVGGFLAANAPDSLFSSFTSNGEVTGFASTFFTGASPSGFFGALIAGFVAGYLMVGLRKLFDKLPQSLEGIKPVLLYPVLGVLGMGVIMVFLVNPPVGMFNQWLTDVLNSMGGASKAILGLVLGGMMSIDFGGPLNKAAYVFGTAAIAGGQTDIMAAVMVGGMVPPLAIALATIFFKNKFTKKERQSGVTNIVMGLSFITEGAIPFAAQDPIHVIPPCAVGAALAGCLSMVFGCTLPAPHGGIFVFPVVGNPLMYIVALAAGTAAGGILMGLFKKPAPQEA